MTKALELITARLFLKPDQYREYEGNGEGVVCIEIFSGLQGSILKNILNDSDNFIVDIQGCGGPGILLTVFVHPDYLEKN